MVDWVDDEVQGRLTVQVDSNMGRDCNLAFHMNLELTKEGGLLPGHGERHVLALARAQAGIPKKFGLPTDGSSSRQEHEIYRCRDR